MRRLLVENFWQFAMALSQSFSVNSTLGKDLKYFLSKVF